MLPTTNPTQPEDLTAEQAEELRVVAKDLFEQALHYAREGFLVAARAYLHSSEQLVILSDEQHYEFYRAIEMYRKDQKMRGL